MKVYSKEYLIAVLKNNLNYEVYEDRILGQLIIMDNYDAYKYVVMTGHGYLDLSQPELRVIIRRDMYRVLNQIDQYEVQFGLFQFDKPEFFSTTNKHIEQYPFMVDGECKKLIFVEYEDKIINSEPMLYAMLKEIGSHIINRGERTTDYIVCPIRKRKLVDFEPFFEYIVSEIYNRNGYITDTQVPFFYGIGTPDAAAYNRKDIIEKVQEYVSTKGFSIFELMTLKSKFSSKRKRKTEIHVPESLNAVFEVKTGSVDGSQINKYISKDIFTKGFEVIPHKARCSSYSGLINCGDRGDINIIDINNNYKINPQKLSLYNNWLENYMKFYIIANLTDEELVLFKKIHRISSTDSLIKYIKNNSIARILEEILE